MITLLVEMCASNMLILACLISYLKQTHSLQHNYTNDCYVQYAFIHNYCRKIKYNPTRIERIAQHYPQITSNYS